MPKFFVKNNQVSENEIYIVGNDVNHIKNVLRMKVGDRFNVCDEDYSENYLAEIEDFKNDIILCKVVEKIENKAESNVEICIYQGLPKADKMELIIQKSVELGVKEIVPVEMKRSVVKLTGKDRDKKIDRWQKIAEVAAKQCGRDVIPKISSVASVREIAENFKNFNLVFLCYEKEDKLLFKHAIENFKEKNTPDDYKIAVVIGPEGGIDESEVELMKANGATVVSLGNRILRTETVALYCASIIMYEFERMED